MCKASTQHERTGYFRAIIEHNFFFDVCDEITKLPLDRSILRVSLDADTSCFNSVWAEVRRLTFIISDR